jgi:hypothetical protein
LQHSEAALRYFLDTEYNGWGGALLSLALVADSGEELYFVLEHDGPLEPWVERNVVPYFQSVPEAHRTAPLSRSAAAEALALFLSGDRDPLIVADWPEDIAHLASLLVTGPGLMVPLASLRFQLVALTGFSTAANSAVPHNALHDARALRDHMTAPD